VVKEKHQIECNLLHIVNTIIVNILDEKHKTSMYEANLAQSVGPKWIFHKQAAQPEAQSLVHLHKWYGIVAI